MKNIIIFSIFIFTFLEINAQPQWIIYQTGNSGLPSNFIRDIVIDSNNIKWIGTDSGLVKFNNQQWIVYNTSNSGLPTNFIYKLAVDKKNNLWIGTIGHGLIKFDGINWTRYDTINSLGIILAVVMGIQSDSLNNLWICNNNGLLKFSNNNWTLYNTTNSGLPDNSTTEIRIENNIKWIGTQWHGLVKYNDTNWIVYNTANSGIPMNFVQSIFIDNFKNKWIGTYLGGAAKFNSQNNIWTLYNTIWPGFPGNDIRTIFIESSQIKWFGIGGAGAVKYNDTAVVLYGYPLYGLFALKIISDKYNNIWIGTNNELAVFNSNGVIGINQKNSNVTEEFKLYQNYPNPFNPSTRIKFDISNRFQKNSFGNYKAVLIIFDNIGREIQTFAYETLKPGSYEVIFNGDYLSSGVYYYALFIDGIKIDSKKLVLLK